MTPVSGAQRATRREVILQPRDGFNTADAIFPPVSNITVLPVRLRRAILMDAPCEQNHEE
jgi:hypothetical protein